MRHNHLTTSLLFIMALNLLPFGAANAENITIPEKGASPTIDRIRSDGVLTAGAAILAPWLLQNPENNEFIGPVAIIAEKTAEALNVNLEYRPTTWATLIAGLLSQKYQIAAGAILETKPRKEVIGFVNFGYSGTCYVVRPDSEIEDLAELNDADVLFLAYTGLGNGVMFHEKYPKAQMQHISPPPGYAPRIPGVLSGRGDVAAIDSPLAYWVEQEYPEARLIPAADKCITDPDLNRPIGIGYPKGDEVFANFLKQVVAANQEAINNATRQFSQPEWLNR